MTDEVKILFLDDAGWRHSTFTRLTDRMPNARVWQAHHAAGAIALLSGDTRFDQVFLDHDLSEEDQNKPPGDQTRVPTGMTVVDYILTMDDPPREIYVHTCNVPAGDEMVRRLRSHPKKIHVLRFPFPLLIQLAEQSLKKET